MPGPSAKGASAENVAVPVVAQRHHEQFGTLEDALDLECEELVGARPQRLDGAHPLLVDDRVNPRAQRRIGDPDEPPRLHQPDTGG